MRPVSASDNEAHNSSHTGVIGPAGESVLKLAFDEIVDTVTDGGRSDSDLGTVSGSAEDSLHPAYSWDIISEQFDDLFVTLPR